RNVALRFTAVLALAANLLVPMQVVKYHACCLDQHGYLLSVEERCGGMASGTTMVSPDACCNPDVKTLRHAPAQPISQISADDAPNPLAQAVLPLPPTYVARLAQARDVHDAHKNTGPPASSDDLLPLHVRLNV
ncbi:MAG: hypothetical protein KIS92_24820, partial [Planctomycetota bacterium]|nr:hypothetical protein [Planctomycetota bacterium]